MPAQHACSAVHVVKGTKPHLVVTWRGTLVNSGGAIAGLLQNTSQLQQIVHHLTGAVFISIDSMRDDVETNR